MAKIIRKLQILFINASSSRKFFPELPIPFYQTPKSIASAFPYLQFTKRILFHSLALPLM
jgi:hypothetical protein